MKLRQFYSFFGVFILIIISCQSPDQNNKQVNNLALKKSQPEILYYQKWAECANYKIVDRTHYFTKNDSTVIFPVTVKDDLMSALAIDFNVTDTFHIVLKNGEIVSVTTSSNDNAEYYKAKEWVNKNRPELVKKQCEGIWEGGPTPCECVLGMIKGFTEYTENKQQAKD